MRRKLLISVFPFLCIGAYTRGATWYVDGSVPSSGDGLTWKTAFKSIQEGVDAAAHGDAAIVAPGTYPENVRFRGFDILLTSTDPSGADVVANTVIRRGVTFAGNESETCRLSGFRVGPQSGISGHHPDRNTHATIQNNVVTGNYSDFGAGVIWCDGPIRNNVIMGNRAVYEGGGLAYCNGVIENNIIVENCVGLWACPGRPSLARSPAPTQEYPVISPGGGLYRCDGIIRNNIIAGNRATEYNWGLGWAIGCGGGLAECNGIIEGNVIWGNVAEEGEGGGLYLCNAVIRNNTIVGNSAEERGGGLASCDGVIRSSIIWGNSAKRSPQISGGATYSCIQDWTGGGEGNISDDPRFVDAGNGDFRLLPDSPCRNAGNTVAVLEVALSLADNGALISWSGGNDLDGNPRISGAAVDMGAYEYQEGPPSLGFVLEHSSDMTFWESIDVGSVWQWLDEMSDGLGRRFYRIGVR